jgi:rhamnogalacturonan endolyase
MLVHAILARCLVLGLTAAVGVTSAGAAEPSPATVTENDRDVVLENGLISLTLARHGGKGSSLKYRHNGTDVELSLGRNALYFDVGGGRVYPVDGADCQVLRKDAEAVEVAWGGKPTGSFPFATEMHCVLPRGESGFYLYAVYQHGPGMGAGGVGETRFVIKGVPGTEIFTHHVVDDQRKGPYPAGKTVEQVQDATFLLEDGTIYTKYDNSAYLADHHVHGMAGHGVGMWMITASNEYIGGGPFKQELTVHKDNVLLSMFVGGHFGSAGLRLEADEPWTKVYGPVFVYVNEGDSVDGMWADAKTRATTEMAKWPYTWLRHAEYPLQRGTVSGRVRLTDGTSAKGAWAVLAPPGEEWWACLKGYDFWTKVGGEGRFTVPRVRPGRYSLHLIGANQFEEFRKENVEVEVGKETDLGELKWEPLKHGRTLWQIGVADRTPHEFKGGDNYRHYDNFLRYAKEFPEDVTFVIGKSKESEDWNFAQWNLYNKNPYWTIKFDLPEQQRGKATLTLGFASAIPPAGNRTNLLVRVNGQEVAVVHLAKSGMAGYRSGSSDSVYNVVYVTFDAGLLRKGDNEITLGHAEARPFPAERPRSIPGEVMYDAIRLEVDPEAPPKNER